jgi:ABC-type amino acid transport substrate-binding protein
VVEYLYSELKKKEIDLIDIAQGGNLSINLGDFISSNDVVFNAFDEAIRKKLDDGELIAIIENLLSQEYNGSAEMKSERGYYIWSWK